ncbi:hypothetical protein BMF94_6922 [Rhodotorula taiwanensis]|uniref:Uncharacterized protein n=1 Tax=Rhodotorula taiwanensis TaxID=741276 RepID=A0A2S5AZY0_9BASI|nr:hypothetical protein BMF94_6922 [Rhodotorula taiwanensis]
MGLAHFAAACPAERPTLQAAQMWCIAQEGICCGICGNTLAALGSRAALGVFFSTAVTVVDGAESPFNFMTACVQAVAYLVVILVKGFIHAYYALVAALGFLCPLAASAVTATHYNYGGAHVETGKRLKRYGMDPTRSQSRARTSLIAERSLGPFSPTAREQLHATRARQRRHRPPNDQEKRPLVSMRENSPTFASTLALALAVRPGCDLLKAIWKRACAPGQLDHRTTRRASGAAPALFASEKVDCSAAGVRRNATRRSTLLGGDVFTQQYPVDPASERELARMNDLL